MTKIETEKQTMKRWFFARAMLIVLFFAILRYAGLFEALGKFNAIILPIYIGLALAFLMNPIQSFLEDHWLGIWLKKPKEEKAEKRIRRFVRLVCTIIALAFIIACVAAFLLLVLPRFIETVTYLSDNLYEKIVGVVDWADELTDYRFADVMERTRTDGRIYVWIETAESWLRDYLKVSTTDDIIATATSYGIKLGNLLVDTVIGIFIAIYLVLLKERYKGYCKRFLYGTLSLERANQVVRTVRKGNEIFYGFIIGKLFDSAIIGVICLVGMRIMNMPYQLLCSFIVGVTNIIPVFGPYIGAVPTVILIFVTNPPQGILFLIFIIVLQQVDGNLIGPRILGDSTGISSIWVIIAITVGGGLFGFLGMLLGVPTCALLLYIAEELIETRLKRDHLPVDPAVYGRAKKIEREDPGHDQSGKIEREE